MTNFKQIELMIDEVLKKEGGFVDHKSDRGGPTNFGITRKTLSKWFGRDASVFDVRNLKVDIAKEIYRQNYYYVPQINELPFDIQPIVFDSAINHGPRRAVRFMQNVLSKAGFKSGSIDGIIGAKTRIAAFTAETEMGEYFNNAVVDERINFYKLIVSNDKTQEVFIKGWLARAESFRKEV
ncbi:MAG: hypothetical protein GY714_12210 [Desulfobacterales bacterium]|nr:hypothetical protein [Desulfobacterales bacterium]